MNRGPPRSRLISAPIRICPSAGWLLKLPPYQGVWRPFAGTQWKRPASVTCTNASTSGNCGASQAKESTTIAESTYLDQERGLLFNLRNAFVQTLQAKAVLQNAKENLDYWDRELGVNRKRFKAGDLAQVDLDRLELQRVQFESDFETAMVNLRTAKIQLLMLLNDRTPIEQFDVTGPFDFTDAAAAAGRVPQHGAGNAAGPEGRHAERGTGQDQSSAGGRQRLDRSDVQRVVSRTILRSTIRSTTIRSAAASAFRCASSTATRARRRARRSTSAATSDCGTPPRRRCSATSIRPTGRWSEP